MRVNTRAVTASARRVVAVALGVAMLVAAATATPGVVPPAAALAVPTSFTFTGAGFGHGVGMSQYGAYAQALAGRSAAQILASYYPGTTLGTRPDDRDIKVGLRADASYVGLSVCPVAGVTEQPRMTVTAGGQQIQVPAGAAVGLAAVPPPAGQTGTWVEVRSANRVLGGPVPVTDTKPVVVRWTGTRALPGPAGAILLTNTAACPDNLAAPNAPSSFRYGRMLAYSSATSTVSRPTVALVNELQLGDEYLDGIAEMPSSWGKPRADGSSGAAALAAQAIAARGYALRKVASLASKPGGVQASCRCHILPTTQDQVFVGWKKAADPTYGRYWTAAVDATERADGTGEVVLYNESIASTNYYSSSGGRTENVWEVWNSSQSAYPYLRSVADQWSLDPASGNPYRSWTRTYSQALVAGAVGLPDVVLLDLSQRTTGGSLAEVVATSSTGRQVTLAGATFRSRVNSRAGAQALPTFPSAWIYLPPAMADPVRDVSRLGGPNRWATAAQVAQSVYPTVAPAVVLASGLDAHLVDGLVAGPLARAAGGPVLLVGAAIPSDTAAELRRLAPDVVYLVGGPSAMPAAVAQRVRELLPQARLSALAGTTRYDTAARVAQQVALLSANASLTEPAGTGAASPGDVAQPSLPDVVLAAGGQAHLADALAVSGPAGALGWPILLSDQNRLPEQTRQALAALSVERVVVVGGPGAVSDAVVAELPSPQRVSGADRYTTAVAVAGAPQFAAVPADTVVLVGGEDSHLVDALPAGALGRRVLLSPAARLPTATEQWLQEKAPLADLIVVGGTNAVSAAVVTAASGGG
jgi:SpoIID/LytB domain protein